MLPRKLEITQKLELLVLSFRLVLDLELKQKIWASSCSSSNLNKKFEQARARAQTFCMVQASSSSSSNVLNGFEQARAQARTFCLVSSKLELKLELFFWSSKQPVMRSWGRKIHPVATNCTFLTFTIISFCDTSCLVIQMIPGWEETFPARCWCWRHIQHRQDLPPHGCSWRWFQQPPLTSYRWTQYSLDAQPQNNRGKHDGLARKTDR